MYELLALHTVVPISKHGRRFDEQSANLCRHSRIRRASQLILNECLQGSVSIAMLKYRMVAVRPARRDKLGESPMALEAAAQTRSSALTFGASSRHSRRELSALFARGGRATTDNT
jgi:hypothetical protein